MGEAKDNKPPWSDRLQELLVPVLRHQIERHGIKDTGAANFYNIRVQEGYIYRNFEIELTRKLLACGLDIRRIDEIGSGFGHLMFLLGWNGFKTVGYESLGPRARTAAMLREVLNLVEPELTGNIQLFQEEFPSSKTPPPEPGSLVLTTNLVSTRSEAQVLEVLKAMRRYPFVLSDVLRFFEERSDPEEGLALFAKAGLKNHELFYDAGVFGRFYLFVNAD
ncbi:MAG: hypothetical protein K2X72_19790 [Reyranella sp.]|nr:hypothetical protein [Reyranella sp.]